VRRAVAEDFANYLQLAKRFHTASPMHNVISFDENGYSDFFHAALENDDIGMWAAVAADGIVGIAGALAYPMYFSPTNKVVQELWWWLDPTARGSGAGKEMFHQIELWAAEKNAVALFMIALEDNRAKKMENLYVRAGFRPMERTFMREVA
jgi:GNAT superfamily N-acetyltransferase